MNVGVPTADPWLKQSTVYLNIHLNSAATEGENDTQNVITPSFICMLCGKMTSICLQAGGIFLSSSLYDERSLCGLSMHSLNGALLYMCILLASQTLSLHLNFLIPIHTKFTPNPYFNFSQAIYFIQIYHAVNHHFGLT